MTKHRNSGPKDKRATALKFELKQLQEQLKESCERLPEKEQHLFAADCVERSHLLFFMLCPGDERLRKAITLRRQWANGQVPEEAWNTVRDIARQIAQEALPTPALPRKQSPHDMVRQKVKTGVGYLAQATVAGPYEAACFAADAFFAFVPSLSRYEEDVRWQLGRVQQYLHKEASKPKEQEHLQKSSSELAEEIRYLDGAILVLCYKLNKQDQHRFAVDCAQRSLPLFERQFPGYPQPGEALRLRRLLADQQISEHDWLVATNNVLSIIKTLGLQINVKEDINFEKNLNVASLAANSTIVDPATAALYSSAALLVGTKTRIPYEMEVRWQWERCLHYFRNGTTPEPQPEAAAATHPRELMPATRSLSRPPANELPDQEEQIDLLCSVLPKREQHLFIADCAERALPFFEVAFPHEKQPREAIRLRRLFAENKISTEEWNAARAATYDSRERAIPRNGTRLLPPNKWTPAQAVVIAAASINCLETSNTKRAAKHAAVVVHFHSKDPNIFSAELEWQLTRLFHYLRGEPPIGPV